MTRGYDSKVERNIHELTLFSYMLGFVDVDTSQARWRLQEAKAIGNYVPAQMTGKAIFTSGQIPLDINEKGKVGLDVTMERAQVLAAECALKCIAAIKTVHDVDDVRIIKITCMVNSDPDFTDQHLVANGASDIITKVFGRENGLHAREAFGVSSLPTNAPVEISIVAEVGRY